MEWIKVGEQDPPKNMLILLAWDNYNPDELGPVAQTGFWSGWEFKLFEVGFFKPLPRLLQPTHYAIIPPMREGWHWYRTHDID